MYNVNPGLMAIVSAIQYIYTITLTGLDWGNLSANSAAPADAQATNANETINGPNTTVTVRITVTSAMSATRTIEAQVNGVTVATGTSGTTLDVGISPGEQLRWRFTNTNDTPTDNWTGTATVTNESDGGAVLDTFTYAMNVQVADDIMDAIAWGNISDSATAPFDPVATTTAEDVTGINTTVTIRMTVSNALTNGISMSIRRNGEIVATTSNSGTTVEATFTNGQTCAFEFTRSNNGTYSGTATITNETDGGVTLDTFTYSITRSALVGVSVTL